MYKTKVRKTRATTHQGLGHLLDVVVQLRVDGVDVDEVRVFQLLQQRQVLLTHDVLLEVPVVQDLGRNVILVVLVALEAVVRSVERAHARLSENCTEITMYCTCE